MIVLGLTGSIGMGKTATAAMFSDLGVPVYDADRAVHALYEKGGAAVEPISKRFSGTVIDGVIDRNLLRAKVVDQPEEMAALEAIVHPLVGQAQLAFRQSSSENGANLCVLDIPLLFETGGNLACDYTLVVSVPADVQKARVLARDGMNEDDFLAILDRQMPDADKRAAADFVVSTAFGFDFTRAHVSLIANLLIEKAAGNDD